MKRALVGDGGFERGERERLEDLVDTTASESAAASVADEERALLPVRAVDYYIALEHSERKRSVVHITVNHRQVHELVAEVLRRLVRFGRGRPQTGAFVVDEHVIRRQLAHMPITTAPI